MRKLRKQAHDAMNKVHAAEDTVRIHNELDRLGGKTHLIYPVGEPSICSTAHRAPSTTPRTGNGHPSHDPPVGADMIHPTIMQDMRAFDVDALGMDSGDGTGSAASGSALFNLDFPSTGFGTAPMDFSFPEFDFNAMASASSSGSGSSPEAWMNGIGHGMSGVNGANGINGANGVDGAHGNNGVSGMNGVHGPPRPSSNGMLDASLGISSGPPVLDATWQAFVEQLGF